MTTMRKDKVGHRTMLKMCKPRRPSKHNKARWHDAPADYAKLYSYCQQDVRVERAIHESTPDLCERNRRVWLMNLRINDRGIPMDREFIENVIATEETWQAALVSEFQALTNIESPRRLVLLVEWLRDEGVTVKSLGKEHVEEALAREDLPPHCRRALELRQLTSRTSTKKYHAMLARMDADDRIRGEHLFHGASTGRFAGSGVQIQNLPRPSHGHADVLSAIEVFKRRDPALVEMAFGDLSAIAVSCIRSAIKANDDHRLLICDYANIEARVLGWMAGESSYQAVFYDEGDIYIDMARRIYGTDEITDDQRHLGKCAILGLGYGMGHEKFYRVANLWGASISEQEARDVVAVFRTSYTKIRAWWYKLDEAAQRVLVKGEPQAVGQIVFFMEGRYLFASLPSGRRLSYVDPQVRSESTPVGIKPQLSYMGQNSVTHQWERKRTWGSKLCENIIQAIACDLLVNAIFTLEKEGYPVVFHVHDEVVVELPHEVGSVYKMEKIMCWLPDWAKGCIVAAEGIESERYRKF